MPGDLRGPEEEEHGIKRFGEEHLLTRGERNLSLGARASQSHVERRKFPFHSVHFLHGRTHVRMAYRLTEMRKIKDAASEDTVQAETSLPIAP